MMAGNIHSGRRKRMSEQVITIKEVAEKPGKKGPFKIVTSENGAKFYAFDVATFPSLKEGASVKLVVEQQGDYTHIKGVVIEGPKPTPQPTRQPPQAKPAAITLPTAPNTRENSIEAQVAFKGLVELDVAGKLDLITHAAIIEWAVKKMDLDIKEEPVRQPKLGPQITKEVKK
jgi:hypothetical protein